MNFEVTADLHLHSKYSRAVSREMEIPTMAAWAARKGIGLVGTGDFTHPLWSRELEAGLEEAGEGVYRLKSKGVINLKKVPELSGAAGRSEEEGVLFMLTTELSCIYEEKGKVRRIHLVVFLPSFSGVHKFVGELGKRGVNLAADGRPILAIPAAGVVEMLLTADEKAIVIPAHIWTPWFGALGENGGYDSLGEVFGRWVKWVPAIETGMSSDPAMNWRITELDDRRIVSFGDAHSPMKMGREATIFRRRVGSDRPRGRISYSGVYGAIWGQKGGDWEVGGTIEFYPEEGKYHFTGHRRCGVRRSPEETKKMGVTCPVCGRSLTVGVAHRVEKLAGREVSISATVNGDGLRVIKNADQPERPGYVMLVPLAEIVAEAVGQGATSRKAMTVYERLVAKRSELAVLMRTGAEEIRETAGERVAEGIMKVRRGEVSVDPGYDGVFGQAKIWGGTKGRSDTLLDQMALF